MIRIAPHVEVLRKIHAVLTPAQRRRAAALMGLVVLGAGFEAVGVGIVVPLAALLLQDGSVASLQLAPWVPTLRGLSRERVITAAMLALVGVYAVKAAFLAFLAWKQASFALGTQSQLARRLFTIYLRQPYTFHLQRNSAELISNVTNEVGLFTTLVMNLLVLATEGLVLLGLAGLLVVFEPVGTLAVVAVLGAAMWIVYRATGARMSRWGVARQHHEARRLLRLQQGLDGARDVKLLGREGHFIAQYDLHQTQTARIEQRQRILQQIPRLWLELLAVTGLAILVLFMVARGDRSAGIVPTLGLFAVAAFRLTPSANRVLTALGVLRYTVPALELLHRELQLGSLEPPATSPASAALQQEIRLVDVAYAYPNASAPALDDLCMHVRKGESVGLVGSTGAGKTTLVDVILGLLAPTAGRVLVDGIDIQRDLRAWQDQVGYVPQFIYLTDDTLRRNIAFGLADHQIDDTAVTRAVRAAQLEEFVAGLPGGLETVVGENGVRLSGGQRQRVGIARALYHDPAVLVLDEATSALDGQTEQAFMDAVSALHGSKTVLIVAHRLSTVARCDRLYELESGRVIAETVLHGALPPVSIGSA